MKPNRSVQLLVLLLVGSVAVVAWAGFVHGTLSWSGVSGTGARHHAVVTRAEYFALRGLKVHDYDGRTCMIEVEQASFNGGKHTSNAGVLRACEPRSVEAWKNLDVGAGLFITSIDVCLQRPDAGTPRLRGIRVQSASLNPDGSLAPARAKTEILFGECRKWEPRKSCPRGAVATGLRATYDDANEGYAGLELRCHTLKATGSSEALP